MIKPDKAAVSAYLKGLQQRICSTLEVQDGTANFITDAWQRDEEDRLQGGGISRVISDGAIFEQGGVNFSHVRGGSLPASATAHRPELAGRAFEAMGCLRPEGAYLDTR